MIDAGSKQSDLQIVLSIVN